MKSARGVGISTDVGTVREGNEDAAMAVALPGADGAAPSWLLVVADGMGGHAAGEVASRMAVETASDEVRTLAAQPSAGDNNYLAAIDAAFTEANARIYQLSQDDAETHGMGTTLVVAVVNDHHLALGHVGDSRAYLLRQGVCRQLTRDHTLAQQMVDAGTLTPAEAERSELSSRLTRAVGKYPTVTADLLEKELQDGDVLILCTDGLYHSVTMRDMANTLRSHPDPQVAVVRLVEQARVRDGKDNITAVCCRIGQAPPAPWDLRRMLMGALAVVLLLLIFVGLLLARQHPSSVPSKTTPYTPPSAYLHLAVNTTRKKLHLDGTVPFPLSIKSMHLRKGRYSGKLPGGTTGGQAVILDLFEQSPGQLVWELWRANGVDLPPDCPMLLADGRPILANSFPAAAATDSGTLTGRKARGTVSRPRRSLTFYLAGNDPMPVEIEFEQPRRKRAETPPIDDPTPAVEEMSATVQAAPRPADIPRSHIHQARHPKAVVAPYSPPLVITAKPIKPVTPVAKPPQKVAAKVTPETKLPQKAADKVTPPPKERKDPTAGGSTAHFEPPPGTGPPTQLQYTNDQLSPAPQHAEK